MAGEHIGWIYIDPSIEFKIRHKSPSLTGEEVREALLWPASARSQWEEHDVHGRRLIAMGETSTGRVILAALTPVDAQDGTWSLRTARVRN